MSLVFRLLIVMSFCSIIKGELIWVKYGWEIFDHALDARITALGSSSIAYDTENAASSLINPSFSKISHKMISITHQSRFSGIVNSDLISFQLVKNKKPVNVNIMYEGVNGIPDTRDMLLDWGNDGQFGTNDYGEGNGILDDGERLDSDELSYFNQHRFGLHVSFGGSFKKNPTGLAIKLLSYSLGEHYALGVGFDAGIFRKTDLVNIGIVIKNFPASGLIWDNGNIEGTIPSISLGLMKPISMVKAPNVDINVICRVDSFFDNLMDSDIHLFGNSIDFSTGLEIAFKRKLRLRSGKDLLGKITGGVGIYWENYTVDYSFFSSGSDGNLGNNHLLSISCSSEWFVNKLTRNQNMN